MQLCSVHCALDNRCLRVLVVAIKLAKEPFAGDEEGLLIKTLSLLTDELSPEDAELIESVRSELPNLCGELLTHQPDNTRLNGFDFDSFVYTPESAEQGRPITEDTMKLRAELDPSASEAVEQWFECSTKSQDVVDFYNRFHKQFEKSSLLYTYLAQHLKCVGRIGDAIKAIDFAVRLAAREGGESEFRPALVRTKASLLESLGKNSEAIAVLEQGLRDFSTSALLHSAYSRALWEARGGEAVPRECVEHALNAIKIDPTNITWTRWGCLVTRASKDYAASIELGERYLALATAPEDKINALAGIAEVYCANELYDDSIKFLKKILAIDGCHAETMADFRIACICKEEKARRGKWRKRR